MREIRLCTQTHTKRRGCKATASVVWVQLMSMLSQPNKLSLASRTREVVVHVSGASRKLQSMPTSVAWGQVC